MKRIAIILVGVIIFFVLIVFAVMQIKGWMYINKDNPEPTNKNINFVGTSKGFYVYGKSCQYMDGSIITASTLYDIFTDKDYISLMKFSPKGKFESEKRIGFATKSVFKIMKNAFKQDLGRPHLEVIGIQTSNSKYTLLLRKFNDAESILYLLNLDSKLKLTKTQKIKLDLVNCTDFKAVMQNEFAYLTYIDETNKMLCQAKIASKDGNIVYNAMLFYRNSFSINAIAAGYADTTVSIAAYNQKVGCSYFMYTKSIGDLKEYFRTDPKSEFTVLKTIGEKTYGVVKEDSVLEIIDLTQYDKPLITLTDKPTYKNFRAVDLQLINGSFYILLQVENPKVPDDIDVVVRKFTPGAAPKEYLIQGKRGEMACELFPTADKHILVLGQSSSLRKGKLLKIFASVFEQ